LIIYDNIIFKYVKHDNCTEVKRKKNCKTEQKSPEYIRKRKENYLLCMYNHVNEIYYICYIYYINNNKLFIKLT
jgi:hypothetical protein